MYLTDLKNKKIAVWGLGKEGHALLAFLQAHSFSPVVLEGTDVDLSSFDVVFKSPGVSLYLPNIQKVIKEGKEITSSTNFYLMNKPSLMKTIAVTGTKGKSTTSSLLVHLMKKMGLNVGFGGNIGVPLISLWGQKFDYLVAELSSYQCADLAVPFDYSVVVNLYPEHIDWHLSHQQYYADKLRLIRLRQKGQLGFLNKTNATSMSLTKDAPDVVYFNDEKGFHLKDGWIMDGQRALFDARKLTNLMGGHNYENICAVLSVLKALHLPLEGIENHIATFQALPHRLQKLETVRGVLFVDDSISTTPETSLAALKAFEGRRIFLLVGGYDRQQDYREVIAYAKAHPCVTLMALPDTGKRIQQAADQANVACFSFDSVQQAVLKAQSMAKEGDVILLSPGAPSYNLYHSFEERGLDFEKSIIKSETLDKRG